MVIKANESSSYKSMSNESFRNLSQKLSQLKRQFQAERVVSVKVKVEKHRKELEYLVARQLSSTATSSRSEENVSNKLLSRIQSPLAKFCGYSSGLGDKYWENGHDVGSAYGIKLPGVERLPPFTTWIFLDKNQKMAEDQSVIGRKRIYYDQRESETVICSDDSDEEFLEPEELKHEFSEAEDHIIWVIVQEHGEDDEVLNSVSQSIGLSAEEIKERYTILWEKYRDKEPQTFRCGIPLDKSLSAALDSFDNLFCRRCLVFDCRLHGCSQSIILPSEKQPSWSGCEEDRKPCSEECYLSVKVDKETLRKGKESDQRSAVLDDSVHTSSDLQKSEIAFNCSEWKPIEKELYLKGMEIFGKNSCLIARNLLSGLKTCVEVFSYMCANRASESHTDPNFMDKMAGTDSLGQGLSSRPRFTRRRGRARKLKYSWKSAGHPSMWKRILNGKNQIAKHYTPCVQKVAKIGSGAVTVQRANAEVGNALVLLLTVNVTQTFVATVGCGGGSLGEPPRQGDGQCGNMRVLLRQQQRILLGKSDLTGWGAFLKNSVEKHDYLGEYTGELISHIEAERRGKIYDRVDCSFLFNLDDEYVLDAFRKGDKLKFANHSPNPNCYCKVSLVAGDHRVGIFAKERMEARQELFYDYGYGPDTAPIWARKSERSSKSKKEDSSAILEQGLQELAIEEQYVKLDVDRNC
ncbi:hypothetical protein ACFE04_017111 [Oxalis oulophora]